MIAEINGRLSVPADGGAVPVSHASPIPANGWPLRPFQIVSLLEMLKAYAHIWVEVHQGLVNARHDVLRRHIVFIDDNKVRVGRIDAEQAAFIKRLQLAQTVQACSDVGIDVTEHIGRIDTVLRTRLFEPYQQLESLLNELIHGIEDDLKKRMFVFVPPDKAAFHDQDQLFGERIATRFPKANKEIKEAGTCYANGSYTACVFHLMRAVEIGAKVMIAKRYLNAVPYLPYPLQLCEWGQLKQALDKAVDALRAGSRSDPKKKEALEYYSHAVGVFGNFKDAWRNKVSHGRHTYKAGETKDAIDNTRQLMTHFAEKMREPKRI